MDQFDVFSAILFTIIAIIGACLIRAAQKATYNSKYSVSCGGRKQRKFYVFFFFIFVIFATFRKIGDGTGGSDSYNYIRYFLHCRDNTINLTEIVSERLWYYYCSFIRLFTSNYHVFFFITYGLIVVGFLVFIKKYCPNGIAYSPLILLVWPYLKDFNTLRTGVAIAVFLVGLVLIEKNKWISMLLIIATIFIHRGSILFVPIFIFYYLYKKHINKLKRIRLLLFYIFFIVLVYGLSYLLQDYFVAHSVLTGKDAYYVSMGIGQNIFLRWPMFIAQLCLLILMVVFNEKIRKNEQLNTLRVFIAYDFITIPASLILGMWRANEYLYVARLLMWGEIIRIILTKFNQRSKWLVKLFFVVLFITWFIFRLYQEYTEIDIMPYVFRLTNDWKY